MTAIGVLGQVTIGHDDRRTVVAGRTLPLLLCIFASRANRRVVTETLVDALWDDNAKRGRATLQVHINRLRELLGESRPPTTLVTVPGGYRLDVDPTQLDTLDFEDRVARASHALREGNPMGACRTLENALRGWAEPFGELAEHPLLLAESSRLREIREQAEEDLCEAWLELGRNADAIERLARLTDEEPLRERRWAQRMLALYRDGRQAEALRCYQDIRRILDDELGVSPAPALRRLEEAILLHDQRLVLANRAAAVRPSNNLPPMTPIIGRDDATSTVRNLLTASRLVTVAGMGGVGKTRVALAVAHRLLDELPDGVYLARLDGVGDGALVASAVADSLGLLGADRTEVIDALHANLGSRDVVIVLDNADHVRSDAIDVVESLLARSPNVRVIVTSRQPLDIDGEAVYRLPPLGTAPVGSTLDVLMASPAVQLFLARAERVLDNDFATIDTVATICRELGGSPLAIELAAARVAAMTPTELLERLDGQLDVLRSSRTSLVPRHQSLEQSIAWSFALLADDEQKLFSRLGVFRSGFSLAGCSAVVVDDSFSRERVAELLEVLVHKSLLTVSEIGRETWFTMSAALAGFGRAQLEDADERELLGRRHRDFEIALCIRLSQTIISKADTVIPMLHAEHNNIRAALRWSLDRRHIDEASILSAAMSIYWDMFGYIREGQNWLREVRELPLGPETTWRARVLQASALLASSDVDYVTSDRWFHEADAHYATAKKLKPQAWNRFWWARTLAGRTFLGRGSRADVDQAAELYASALSVFRDAVDWPGLMSTLPYAAIAEVVRGSGDAFPFIEEGDQIARTLGVTRGQAFAAKSRAMEELRCGDVAAAAEHAQLASGILGRMGDRRNEVFTLCLQGLALLRAGDVDPAVAAARDALCLHRRHGNREYAPFVLGVAWAVLAALEVPEHRATREALHVMHRRWATPLITLGYLEAAEWLPDHDQDGYVPLRWPTWSAAFATSLDALSR